MVDVEILKKIKSSMYEHVAEIFEYESVVDDNGITQNNVLIPKYTDVECKLSIKNVSAAVQGETHATISQDVKLFLKPGIEIKPGSVIEVLKDGGIFTFKSSGLPRVYGSHQEVSLISEEENA